MMVNVYCPSPVDPQPRTLISKHSASGMTELQSKDTRAEFLGNESAACSPLAGKKLCDLFLQREKLRDISKISRYRTTLHLMTKRGTRVHVELVRYNSAILQYASWKAWLLEPY
jgi:hypothetical protein